MTIHFIPYDLCEYGNHPMKPSDRYIYTDAANGIPNDIGICSDCLKKHILKYYPDSRMAEHYRAEDAEKFGPLFAQLQGKQPWNRQQNGRSNWQSS